MTTTETLTRITSTIIDLLASGVAPWRKPWSTTGGTLPYNAATGKTYRGLNVFVLWAEAQRRGFGPGGWLTFKQAQSLGGTVRRGEKGTPVVFWRIITKDAPAGAPDAKGETFPMLRHYTVFHVSQCDGLPATAAPSRPVPEPEPIDAAEALTALYTDAPPVQHGGDRAYYSPRLDHVQMPPRAAFEAPASYYWTLWHELAHSTGHESRLARPELAQMQRFGDEAYSTEELTAELSAALMAGLVGLDAPEALAQSAAYLKGWLTALKAEPRMLLTAAARAQRAVDYMTGQTPGTDAD
jgi:antirestriction protein ArdC